MRERLQDWLWPRDRLLVVVLLYAIWVPLFVAVNISDDSSVIAVQQDPELQDVLDDDQDFEAAVGWAIAALWLGYAVLAGWLARIKGRDPIRWGIASLVTFVALLPLLAAAPELPRSPS